MARLRCRAFTKRSAAVKMSVEPPPPPPMPDIMEATSLRLVRKRVTYSRAGSWSRCTHEMQSTGQESMDACRCAQNVLQTRQPGLDPYNNVPGVVRGGKKCPHRSPRFSLPPPFSLLLFGKQCRVHVTEHC